MHLTRTIDGDVHAGPNAVLALAREGYRWRDVDARDLAETLALAGAVALGAPLLAHGRVRGGPLDVASDVRPQPARLVPDIPADDLVRAPPGSAPRPCAATAAWSTTSRYARAPRQVHVLNAPSPAATASLEIGRHIVDEIELENVG